MRMIQGCDRAGLAFKTLPAVGVGCELERQDLDGDGAIEARVPRLYALRPCRPRRCARRFRRVQDARLCSGSLKAVTVTMERHADQAPSLTIPPARKTRKIPRTCRRLGSAMSPCWTHEHPRPAIPRRRVDDRRNVGAPRVWRRCWSAGGADADGAEPAPAPQPAPRPIQRSPRWRSAKSSASRSPWMTVRASAAAAVVARATSPFPATGHCRPCSHRCRKQTRSSRPLRCMSCRAETPGTLARGQGISVTVAVKAGSTYEVRMYSARIPSEELELRTSLR